MLIGKADPAHAPDIALSGLSIRREHAVAKLDGNNNASLAAGIVGAKTKVRLHIKQLVLS